MDPPEPLQSSRIQVIYAYGPIHAEGPGSPPGSALPGAEPGACRGAAAASAGRDTWIEDQIFMSAVKKSIVECGASLFLITHPKKGGGRSVGMDNLAGGACWSRFSQTIMWLRMNDEEKEVEILDNGCRVKSECNRIMTVLKARNSYGGGHNYAMNLMLFQCFFILC